jgi:hypothetical protein
VIDRPKAYHQTAPQRDIPDPSLFSPGALKKLTEHLIAGNPWFIDPKDFDQEVEKRNRKLLRFLKMVNADSGDSVLGLKRPPN